MFEGNFLITVLVAFPIAMIVIRLGIFNSVAYKFGTELSLTTRAWALFLTIITVGIIMGLGLLVEAITSINWNSIMGNFVGGLYDLLNSPLMPMIGIIIFGLVVLFIANKIRKKISRWRDSRSYGLPKPSYKEKHRWSLRESEYWNMLSQEGRTQICYDLSVNKKNAKKNLEKIRGDDKSKIIQNIGKLMSSGEVREINRQYNQWENEFQNKYNELKEEKNYYKDRLDRVLAGGASGHEEIDRLRQKIRALEDRIKEGNVEKMEHDTYSESASDWEILGLQPGSSGDKIKKAYQIKVNFWHPDKHGYETPDMRSFAELQFKRAKAAYNRLMSKN